MELNQSDRSQFYQNPVDVITQNDREGIHQLTLDILSKKGFQVHLEEARDLFKAQGARIEGKVVFLDEPVVTKLLKTAPKEFSMKSRESNRAPLVFGPSQTRPVICPGNGTMSIIEPDGTKRTSSTADYDRITKLCQTSNVVDMVGAIPVVPGDMPVKNQHLQLLHHLMRYSTKPLIGVGTSKEETEESFKLLEMVYGTDYLSDNHVIAYSVNPTTPLGLDPLACQTLIAYAEKRQVVFILPAPMAGLTAPLDMYGMLAIINAENLIGICLTQAVSPGTPVVYSSGALTSDMRWANTITAAPEGTLIGMAAMQMARYYGLPARAMAGLSEAKSTDYQAGMETMQNFFGHNIAGVQVVNECLGVLDSLMSTSFEKWMLDEEMIERMMVINKGLGKFDREKLFNLISGVDHQGSYLMEQDTLENCRNIWKPEVSLWLPYENWLLKKQDLISRATELCEERISRLSEPLLSPELDKELGDYISQR
jgi:trimethylamine---corrinoid protein Co-methyltransferase